MSALYLGIKVGVAFALVAYTWYRVYKSKRTVSYNENEIMRNRHAFEDVKFCTLCSEELKVFPDNSEITLPCQHRYHKSCIRSIFEREVKDGRLCPMCKRQISEGFLTRSLLYV